ncbi:MAG: hypothetical protein JNK23_00050 [Opitutaceae bacterium]|nr:hypothetical protein [Opitutaceae bacterium]
MLPFTRPQPAEAAKPQFFVPLDGHHFSALEFYDQVEADLKARRVPRLRSQRVAFHEGSRLSDKRIYLRLARERFSFEVCAAPFGTGYFFSLRYVVIPRGGWIALLLLLAAVNSALALLFLLVNHLLFHASGWFWIGLGIANVAALAFVIVRNARQDAANPPDPEDRDDPVQEMPDFDAILLSLPVIGDWWERVRRETYYRHDTRLMFQTVVSEVVRKRVEELTVAKGIRLLRTDDHNSFLSEFYKTGTVPAATPEKKPPPHGVD